MIRETDITVNFHPSTIPNARTYGIGTLILFNSININFTVWPSRFGLGIMVAYPSRQAFKDGQPVVDENGKNKYYNEIYISNYELRNMIDNAVINAMSNKGIVVPTPQNNSPQQSYNQAPSNNNYQNNNNNYQNNNSFNNSGVTRPAVSAGYVVPATQLNTSVSTGSNAGSSITHDDDLPF